MNIKCELTFEPNTDACRNFDNSWTSSVRRVLQRNGFTIDGYSLKVIADKGTCHAFMTVSDDSPQASFQPDPDATPPELAPSVARCLAVLQKEYEKSVPDWEKSALYAALSIDDNALQKPLPKSNVGTPQPKDPKGGSGTGQDNNGSDGDTSDGSNRTDDHLVVVLTALNVIPGTYRSSDRHTVRFSRIFHENLEITLSELAPSTQLTNTGREVIALTPQQEIELTNRFIRSFQRVKDALEQGDLITPQMTRKNGSHDSENRS